MTEQIQEDAPVFKVPSPRQLLYRAEGFLAQRSKDNSAKGHVGWRGCAQKSCEPEPSPALGALTEMDSDPFLTHL